MLAASGEDINSKDASAQRHSLCEPLEVTPPADAAFELVDVELLRQDVGSLGAVPLLTSAKEMHGDDDYFINDMADVLDDFVMGWNGEFVADENNRIQLGRAVEDTGEECCAQRRPRRCARARSVKKSSSLGLTGIVLKRKQATIRGVSTYERRKTEMVQLSSEAQELEARLGWLRRASQNGNYPQLKVAVNSRWKELAKRQLSLRRKAECENKTLRVAVANQTQMARSLNQVLRRRVDQAAFLKTNLPQSLPWRSLECSASDQLIYGFLLKDLSVMSLEIDHVVETLQSKIEETSNDSFSRLKVLQAPDVQQPCLEFVRSEVVPFPRANVDQAIHTFSGENNVEMRQYAIETFGVMDDIVVNKIHLSYSTAQGSGHLQIRTAMRHIVQSGRSVFLSVRFYDNVHFEGQHVDGFVLRERKWTILENDTESCDPAAACEATRIQAYSMVGPESTVSPMPTNWDPDTLENIVGPAWSMATSIAQRKIENILVFQAMG